MTAERVALVVGATGVTGFPLVQHLLATQRWKVYGLSRHAPALAHDARLQHVAVDLQDRAAAGAAIAALTDVTHVFYSGNHPVSEVRLGMLATVLDAVEAGAPGFANIHLTQGMKYYGVHLGRHRSPVRETDPRIPGSDFYYAEEDFVLARAGAGRWSWTTLRPHSVCGWSPHNPVTLAAAVAVYATVVKALGRPFAFPASAGCFEHCWQMTDADLLAQGAEWASTTPACANQAFNISNGDHYYWRDLWPRFAAFFGLEPAGPADYGLADFLERHRDVWDDLAARHDLAKFPYERLPGWVRGDYTAPHSRFAAEYDIRSELDKLRRHGFTATVDNGSAFLDLFARFRQERIIP
jgi:nucleoside-diphosphate-sugar epimerase